MHFSAELLDRRSVLISEDVRAFLEQPRFGVMATISSSGSPQLTVMWYALLPDEDVVVLNATRGLLKERNLRRDPRMSLCVEDGMRYVTLEGRAELLADRDQQQREVDELIAPRYLGQRLGSQRWRVIEGSDRVGIRMRVEKVHSQGVENIARGVTLTDASTHTGQRSEAKSMVKYAFIFSDSFAVTVEPFEVLDSRTGNENGARIQIRRVGSTPEPGTLLGDPLWRGDLFRLAAGQPGNWDRAHFHPRFDGAAAGQRHTDPELTKDPINWALSQLRDLSGLAERAGAQDLAAASGKLQPELDATQGEIRAALQRCASA